MRLFLAPGVHAVKVRDDIVFLDTGHDVYFCLGGASDLIGLEADGGVAVGQAMAQQLIAAGLLTQARPTPRAVAPPPLTASTRLARPGRARASIGATLTALRVTWAVAQQFPRRSFAELLAGPPASPLALVDPTPALIAAVDAFERLRPWLPVQGECLLRSYHLRAFLRARGFDALWVLGVRTWPFAAHCWLQAGTTALDDDLERLAAYQPILAV